MIHDIKNEMKFALLYFELTCIGRLAFKIVGFDVFTTIYYAQGGQSMNKKKCDTLPLKELGRDPV